MTLDEVPDCAAVDIEPEASAFRAAIAQTLEELTVLRLSLLSRASALCGVRFDASALMLQSDELLLGTLERIQACQESPHRTTNRGGRAMPGWASLPPARRFKSTTNEDRRCRSQCSD